MTRSNRSKLSIFFFFLFPQLVGWPLLSALTTHNTKRKKESSYMCMIYIVYDVYDLFHGLLETIWRSLSINDSERLSRQRGRRFFCYLFEFDIRLIFPFHFSHPKHAPWYHYFHLCLVSLSLDGFIHLLLAITEMMKTIITQPQNGTERRQGATYIIVSDMGMQTTNRRHQQHLYSTWGDGVVTS